MSQELTLAAIALPVTMAKAVAVCTAVAEGMTVKVACETHFITPISLRAACRKEPMLQAMLDEALASRNDALADMLVDIDKRHSDAKMAAVVSKNIQWVLERNEPARFGAKLTVDMGKGSAASELATALNAAIARIPMPSQPITIEARQVVDVEAEIVERPRPPATEDELRALGLL